MRVLRRRFPATEIRHESPETGERQQTGQKCEAFVFQRDIVEAGIHYHVAMDIRNVGEWINGAVTPVVRKVGLVVFC